MKNVKNPIVGIATHAHSVVDFDVHFNHCFAMQHWVQKYDLKMIGYKGLMAADARELTCETAIEEGCENVFFLDADHFIPVETLDYLMESKDEAIVSGLICRRWHPYDQIVWGKDDKKDTYIPANLGLDGKLYEVGVCAFGCTLINLKKLQKLEKPWFRDTCDKGADGVHNNIRSDVNLCDMFRAKGEKVWIDTRVLIGHEGARLAIYPQNAEYIRNFLYGYKESFKLREGQTGKYSLCSRLL